jgi:hypothetical protein
MKKLRWLADRGFRKYARAKFTLTTYYFDLPCSRQNNRREQNYGDFTWFGVFLGPTCIPSRDRICLFATNPF